MAIISPCRVCQRPTRGTLCVRCFKQFYPEAAERADDTRKAEQMARTAEAYERARQADEADAPIKRRGPG